MRTRSDAATLINSMLALNYGESKTSKDGHQNAMAHHFGRCELRILMDFIYQNSEPTEAEKIK